MKTRHFLTLLLALACALMPMAALANGAIIARYDDEEFGDYVRAIFSDKDTLYLWGDKGIYTYKAGDAAPTLNAFSEDAFQTVSEGSVSTYINPSAMFMYEGTPCLIVATSAYDEEASVSTFKDVALWKSVLEGGKVTLSPMDTKPDWSDMVETSGEDTYFGGIQYAVCVGGTLYTMGYSGSGDLLLNATDMATGENRSIDVENLYAIAARPDGTLLAEQYDYSNSAKVTLACYDPAADQLKALIDMEVSDYSPPQGLCCGEDANLAYFVTDGMVRSVNLTDGTVTEIADMPLPSYNQCPGAVFGNNIAFCADAVAIRSLNASDAPEIMIRVANGQNEQAFTNAYYEYTNAHPDVAVALSSSRISDEEILKQMMNQDSTWDIFYLSVQSSAFEALLNRGFTADLSGSEIISSLMNRMYPAVQKISVKDGEIVSMPISVYGNALGVKEQALKALGLTLQDVPDNWPDFLDWLIDLSHHWDTDKGVTLFYKDAPVSDCRSDLCSQILTSYMAYLTYEDRELSFDTPELRTLLEKLDKIDFSLFGQAADPEEGENYGYGYSSDDVTFLVETYTGCTPGYMYGESTPILLSVDGSAPGVLPLSIQAAVVNPFSQHKEEALAYLGKVAEQINDEALYTFCTDLTEPLRSRHYEESLKYATKNVEDAQAALDKAEEADRQALEEELEGAKKELEYAENDWKISPENIEWYRAHTEGLVASRYNALYSTGIDSSEIGELFNQYRAGKLDSVNFLKQIEKKVRMLVMEGN